MVITDLLLEAEVSGVGTNHPLFTLSRQAKHPYSCEVSSADAPEAARIIFDALAGPTMPHWESVGYRVVHPGPKLIDHQRITPEVLQALEQAAMFAPLHDPSTLAIIREGMVRFPNLDHYACFDTVFHKTMPEAAFTYPIPASFREQGVRRYGFHGLSCESIVEALQSDLPHRMVIAHLGSGCSVTALIDGRSVDTSMGLTPCGGVVMGTRSGDLDPGVLFYLYRQKRECRDAATLETLLNHDSGIAALAELPNDMKVIRKAAMEGSAKALLALSIFTRNLTKTIGGYCWLMGGLDAIVFTGGIGENDALTRSQVLAGLDSFDVSLDVESNAIHGNGSRRIDARASKVSIYVIPADEDLTIAKHVFRLSQTHP
jgi:acetate kinase